MADKGGDKKKQKESVVDLAKFIDRQVRVKFQGGRESKNWTFPFLQPGI